MFVKLYDAVALGVGYFIGEHRAAIWIGAGTQGVIKRVAVKDIIAEY